MHHSKSGSSGGASFKSGGNNDTGSQYWGKAYVLKNKPIINENKIKWTNLS